MLARLGLLATAAALVLPVPLALLGLPDHLARPALLAPAALLALLGLRVFKA